MGKQKKIRAGVGELQQYLVHNFNDNTVRFALHYPGLLDRQRLSAAMASLVKGLEVLHSTFHTTTFRAHWTVNEDYEEGDYFRYIQTEEAPMTVAQRLCLESVDPFGKTQLRCYLVQDGKSSALVFLVGHLIADGGDSKYLLLKLAENYERNQAAALKNGSRRGEQVYKGIGLKNYLSLMKNPISKVKTAFPYTEEPAEMPRFVGISLAPELISAAKAKARGATVNDLLLTACYHSFAKHFGSPEQPVSILSMMDLRRHCKGGDSAGLSNLSGTMTTVLPQGLGENFEQSLRMVAEQTTAAKKEPLAGLMGLPLLHNVIKSLPIGLLLRISGRVYGSFSIGLTNLGRLSGEALTMGGLQPDEALFGGPIKKKPAMQISAILLEERCALSIMGIYSPSDVPLLQRLLEGMKEELEHYIIP